MKMTPSFRSRQHGVSLVVTLVLVVLLSLIALYAAGILVLDTRSAANDYRSREALAAAESGVDQGFSLLSANRAKISNAGFDANNNGSIDSGEGWTTCTSSATPCLPVESADRTNWRYLTIASSLLKRPWKDDDADGVKDTSETYLGNVSVYLLTPVSGNDSRLVYNIVAIGQSGDATSTATVKQGAYFYPLVVGIPKSPLMAYGSIGSGGNYNVVTNPNGAGDNVALTAWSREAVSMSGSASSCHVGEEIIGGAVATGFLSTDGTYLYQTDNSGNTITMCDQCTCPTADALSKGGVEGSDIVMNDTTNFPDDVFKYVFGVPYTSYEDIKKNAQVISDCSTLNTSSSGLIWVEGANCTINSAVGSFANPVMLVVEDHDITVNGGSYFFGILFAFSTAGNTGSALSVHMAGGMTLYGAAMSNTDIDMGNGTYKMRFDKNVLANVSSNPSSRALSRIAGSWSDLQ